MQLIRYFSYLSLFLAAVVSAKAEDYPSRPIHMIVPYAAGGSSDVLARVIGERLHQAMGQPVIVDNRPGAGSMIGTDALAKSPADGYNLILSDTPFTINPSIYATLPYNLEKDFTPITIIGKAPLILYTSAESKEKTLGEFIARAKSQRDSVTIGSGGNGTTPHLMVGILQAATGATFVHVPYKGTAPALTDLAGGQIQGVFSTQATAAPFLQGKKLRALALSSDKRNADMPDVPTFAEAGINGMVIEQWWGVIAPAGLPKPILDRLHSEIVKAVQSPEVRARFAALGVEPATNSASEFKDLIRAEAKRWAAAAKTLNLSPH
jgi:tripartite-type tricarboxylate transporter receptor subunit TctC